MSEGVEAGGTESMDLSKAINLSLDQNASEMPVLLREVYSLSAPKTLVIGGEEGIYSGADTYAKNSRAVFYVRDYWVDMAQDDFMAQVYCYDIDTKNEMLLYETGEGTRLNVRASAEVICRGSFDVCRPVIHIFLNHGLTTNSIREYYKNDSILTIFVIII